MTKRSEVRAAVSRKLSPYPFSAIVGQEEMKLALILNVVDPLIGGVLIMGHRGTGKSTAVRSLADLLPSINAVSGCPYNCDPVDERYLCDDCRTKSTSGALSSVATSVRVVELPLGATEDRVCGTIDIERALKEGKKQFDPGLLARANRGFLYIDEVNLLEDHLVDLLLDVAVTGWNKVERENVSVEHPARFVLVGSGNPEEGELRPQLLDRFGLHAEVRTENYLASRVAIVTRREAYDRDPEKFCASYADEQCELRDAISHARKNLEKVKVDKEILTRIAQLCADLNIDGHRGELTIMRAARALAAFENRRRITDTDVRRVATMALRHRLRRDALEETATSEQVEQAVEEVFPPTQKQGKNNESNEDDADQQRDRNSPNDGGSKSKPTTERTGKGYGSEPRNAGVPTPPSVENKRIKAQLDNALRQSDRPNRSHSQSQKSGLTKTAPQNLRGRYARAVAFKTRGSRVAIDATLRALASSLSSEGRTSDSLRYKLLKEKQGTLYIFAIDTSGSMAVNRIARAKSTILRLLRKSYINRDNVAIVSFHGTTAKLNLPPSRSILRAKRVLDSLTMGGSTPLAAGLVCTTEAIKQFGEKHGETVVLLFTDGRSNVPLRRNAYQKRAMKPLAIEREIFQLSLELNKLRVRIVVVDTQRQFESSEDTRRLASVLRGKFVKIDPELSL